MNRGEKICTLYTFLSCEGTFKWRVEGFPHNYDVTLYAIRIDSSTAEESIYLYSGSSLQQKHSSSFDSQADFNAERAC